MQAVLSDEFGNTYAFDVTANPYRIILQKDVHRLKLTLKDVKCALLSSVFIRGDKEIHIRRNGIRWMGQYELLEREDGYYYIFAADKNEMISELEVGLQIQVLSTEKEQKLAEELVFSSRENEILEELVRLNIEQNRVVKQTYLAAKEICIHRERTELPALESCAILSAYAESAGGNIYFKNQLLQYDKLAGNAVCFMAAGKEFYDTLLRAEHLQQKGYHPFVVLQGHGNYLKNLQTMIPVVSLPTCQYRKASDVLIKSFLMAEDVSEKSVQEEKQEKHSKQLSVDIIIPTYNGGKKFRQSLRRILEQKDVEKPGIILVDSGSSDGTPEYAEQLGKERVQVICIPNEDFSHSYARNLGFGRSKADIAVFMTQDAVPTSDQWLNRLLKPFEGDCAAVSCQEIAPPWADMFFRISSHEYADYIETFYGDWTGVYDSFDDETEFRRKASLTDITCAVRTEIFREFLYKNDYAEDLNLGMRLLKAGYKVARLGSVQTIHYHDRDADYYLKRNYVETRHFEQTFGERNTKYSKKQLQYMVTDTLESLETAITTMRKPENKYLPPAMMLQRYGVVLMNAHYRHGNRKGCLESISLSKDSILYMLYYCCSEDLKEEDTYTWKNPLMQELREYLDGPFANFLKISGFQNQKLLDVIQNCLLKRAANELGRCLASSEELWPGLEKQLMAGI